jgi:hypothetical protein
MYECTHARMREAHEIVTSAPLAMSRSATSVSVVQLALAYLTWSRAASIRMRAAVTRTSVPTGACPRSMPTEQADGAGRRRRPAAQAGGAFRCARPMSVSSSSSGAAQGQRSSEAVTGFTSRVRSARPLDAPRDGPCVGPSEGRRAGGREGGRQWELGSDSAGRMKGRKGRASCHRVRFTRVIHRRLRGENRRAFAFLRLQRNTLQRITLRCNTAQDSVASAST